MVKAHSDEIPHKCADSAEMFSAVVLYRHMLIHTSKSLTDVATVGENTRRGHLTQQKLTDTRDKSYKCNNCRETFSRRGHLKYQKLTQA